MSVLLVGGDGLIGRALIPVLREAGRAIRATSYRDPLPPDRVRLDLADPDPGIVEGVEHLVLAAAVVRRADCEADPARAAAINVEAPVRLAAPVLARGGHVVFLSTSIVLGGDTPYLPVDAPYAPFDAYSRQKAEAEQRLRALPGATEGLAILRLDKVLDASYGVIAAWADAARRGEAIRPFSDLVTAPMTVEHVTREIAGMIAERAAGIRHLSGRELTYADLAARLGEALDWDPALIQPVEGRALDPVAAANPPHTSLAAERLCPTDDVIAALARQVSMGR